ncbi:MAG: efflux RND transporter permease subunit, partial [Pseudomonadota bacterium]
PQEDNGVLLVSSQLPAGASLQRTSAFLAKLETIAKQSPGVDSVITVSGFSLLNGMSSDVGMAVITLLPRNERSASDQAWRAIMQSLNVRFAALPEAETYVFPIPSIPGLGSAGGVSAELLDLERGDAAQLESVMGAFIAALNAAPEFASASGNFSGKTPQYRLSIDRDRAQTLGIEIADVFTALQANLSSYYVNNFFRDERIYWVIMSADAEFRQTVSDIDNIYVKAASGESVPISSFVSYEPVLAPDTLPRFNLFSAASISAQLADGVSTGEGIKAMRELAQKQLPTGFRLVFSGSSQQEVEAEGLVIWIMISAALLAYLVLVVLYSSWVLPLSVMASSVFALLGALLPIVLIPGLSNNLFAQIGLVLLIGLAAKKAIMVVEFANQRRLSGATITDAALSAASVRFRPVTMTGMCFILGVLPLILTSDVGSAARQSIGYPVLVGMLVDSTLGLVMIPALYAAFERSRGGSRNTNASL